MKIISSPQKMQSIALKARRAGKTVGLVPTMGALHAGHLSLVRRARKENDIVVVSIFVNPKQFGPNEDYLRYPRPFAQDRAACAAAGVDYLFMPSPDAMYPAGYLTFVTVEQMSGRLCGAFRPGHFRGVATVVSKLFNIVQPVKAYFGEKDYQQLKIIERMVRDMNFPVTVVPCPIVREPSGLALSSRNQYLSAGERAHAATLHAALEEARAFVRGRKKTDSSTLHKMLTGRIKTIPGAKIDYIAVLDAGTLAPVKTLAVPAVIALAVWVGRTRLIDNIRVAVPARRK